MLFPRAVSFKRILGVLIGLVIIWICLLIWKWPFTRSATIKGLSHDLGRSVQIGVFHPTFFPLGFVVEDIRFIDATPNSGPSTVTIRKGTVIASYLNVFLKRRSLDRISIIGLHLVIPRAPATPRNESSSSHHGPPKFTAVGQMDMENSLIEFVSPGPDPNPFKVTVKHATLHGLSLRNPAPFRVELLTNEPSGTVHSEGLLGPLNWDYVGRTPLAGSFTFTQADLSTVGNLEGLLNAQGKLGGSLGEIACSGHIEVPQFGISDSSHALPLSTTFHATVNGSTGDIFLSDVESRLHRTVIKSHGEIKGDGHHAGKTVRLHLSADGGQVDDLLLLFTRSQQASMTGTISLQADIDLPPGDPGFLQRLKLRGDFGMSDSRFTKASTQAPISHLSESAEGVSKGEEKQDTRVVLSDIKGYVSAQNGVASLSHISFVVPGAEANLAGTYNLLNKAVHLEGTLRTTGKISNTTSGLKAGFLTLLSPLLKKHSVTVVPFKITGTAQHSTLALDLARKKRY